MIDCLLVTPKPDRIASHRINVNIGSPIPSPATLGELNDQSNFPFPVNFLNQACLPSHLIITT